MGNQEWAIQRHWQHWIPITQDEDKQNTKKQSNTRNYKDQQHGPTINRG
jgi:hypothetical protein